MFVIIRFLTVKLIFFLSIFCSLLFELFFLLIMMIMVLGSVRLLCHRHRLASLLLLLLTKKASIIHINKVNHSFLNYINELDSKILMNKAKIIKIRQKPSNLNELSSRFFYFFLTSIQSVIFDLGFFLVIFLWWNYNLKHTWTAFSCVYLRIREHAILLFVFYF